MSRTALAIAVTGVLSVVVGCSGADSAPTTADAATDTAGAIETGGADTASPADDATSDVDPAATKPATPTMASAVEKKAVGVQATWRLNDIGLSAVELWRKKDLGAYAKLISLGGAETTSLDATATGMFTYCYKVKTLRDGLESDFSAEKCLMTGM